MGFLSSFKRKNDVDILLLKLQKAELKLKALPKTNLPNTYDDTSSYIKPLVWNEDLLLNYCDRSAIMTSILGVLLKECTKDNWEIKPMFSFKCTNEKCLKEYNHLPEMELCECGAKLRKPNIQDKNILNKFVDDPNPNYDFYEIIRSCLLWELKLDRYYVNVSFTYEQGGYKKLSKTPTGLFVENPRYIRIRETPNEKFCPLCYKPDKIYKDGETTCSECGAELWETYYIKLETPYSDVIVARYKKEEMIEGHYNRQLPDLYGTPKLVSAIQQLQALIGLDSLNSDIFVKRKLNKIFVFNGATQDQINEIRDNVENNVREGFGLKRFLYDVYLGISGASDIKVFDALPDAEKLQSLEWYKFYREVLASVFEVPPVFSGVVESGKAGNNPNIQDVVMGSTKRGLIRTIEEPFNKRIMEAFGITDYYIAFPDFTIKDELREAQIQKIKAETANIFLTSGFEVQYVDNDIVVSEKAKNQQKQIQPEVQYIDVEEVIDDPVKYEKFEKMVKKKNLLLKSLQEIESYFLFIAEQLYKVDYQHQKNILSIVKKFEKHKSRSQLVTDIEEDIKDTSVALKSLLSIYLKNVYLKSFNDTHKEYSIKKLFALQELKKEDLKVTGGFLDEVTPYNLSFLEQFFATYETPFMQGWEDEQKKAIFGFLEELMMTGYSYDRAERGLKKLLGENPYGMDNKTYWEMVGRTEATRVFTQASLASAKSLGYTMKRVKTVVGCERCKEFEAQGAIPIDQPYENTLLNNPDIPFHPNCMCHYQYELEQGKYFSQYSYEPDKKLKPEVDLLAYDADLSKMNEEQLQRWADTHLKTPVDLGAEEINGRFKGIIADDDFRISISSYFRYFYDMRTELVDSILKKLIEDYEEDPSMWVSKWAVGQFKSKELDDIFIKWIEEQTLSSSRKLILELKRLEERYGKLPIKLITMDTDFGSWGYNDYMDDNLVRVHGLDEYILYKMHLEDLDSLKENGIPQHAMPTFEGNLYHEISHSLDFGFDMKNSENRLFFSKMIEDLYLDQQKQIQDIHNQIQDLNTQLLNNEIDYTTFESESDKLFEKLVDLEQKHLIKELFNTSSYSKEKNYNLENLYLETFAENYSLYVLSEMGNRDAIKKVTKWSNEKKTFFGQVDREVLEKYNS